MHNITLAADDYAGQLALVCSADEAAKLLKVSAERVKQFCREGRLAAKRSGRDWIICRAAAVAFSKVSRSAGPPVTKNQLSRTHKRKKIGRQFRC
jgi:excisionase family DNA binding protein